MKTALRLIALFVAITTVSIATQRAVQAQHVSVGFQVFYDELSPYGHWVAHPTLGYVWLPIVEPDFVPYASRGHWVWTEYGWAWVSEYPWGWAPFHYGRWDYDDDFGWFWVPDYEWGPAWVMWSRTPGYWGWAPLRPGIAITIVIGGGYHPPHHWWTFCHDKFFGRRHIRNHYVPRSENGRIIGESRIDEHTYGEGGRPRYLSGPDKGDVSSVTGRPVQPVTISDDRKPGEQLSGSTWTIYRPNVEQARVGAAQPAPKKLESPREFVPPTRGQSTRPQTQPTTIPNAPRAPRPLPTTPPGKEQAPTYTPRTPSTPSTPRPGRPIQTTRPSAPPANTSTPRTPPTAAPPKAAPRPESTPRATPPAQAPKQTPQSTPKEAPKQDGGGRRIDTKQDDGSGK